MVDDLIGRLELAQAKANLRARAGRATTIMCLAGDPVSGLVWAGGGSPTPTTLLPGNPDTVYVRPIDDLTAPPLIARNPSRKDWAMGDLVTCEPMASAGPGTAMLEIVHYAIPGDVFWVAGGGQTPPIPGAPTFAIGDARLIGGGGSWPSPLLGAPLGFYLLIGGGFAFVAADSQATTHLFNSGGPSLLPSDGQPHAISSVDGPLAVGPFSLTPNGSGMMSHVNASLQRTFLFFEFPDDDVVLVWELEYQEAMIYVMDWPNITARRLRHPINFIYRVNFSIPGEQFPPFPPELEAKFMTHMTVARYNPANGLVYVAANEHFFTTPYPVSDLAAIDPIPITWPVPGGPTDIAFDAAGVGWCVFGDRIYRGLGTAGPSFTLAAGDGSGSGLFPADGTAPTSGDLGTITGVCFDALGRLVIGCDEARRLARVTFPAVGVPTIETIGLFGRDFEEWPDLIEPLPDAHFTDFAGLSSDAAGRIWVGGAQVKRIGA